MVISECEMFLLPTQYYPLVVPWPLNSISQIFKRVQKKKWEHSINKLLLHLD